MDDPGKQARRSVEAARSAVVGTWMKLRDRQAAEAGESPPEAVSEAADGAGAEQSLLDRYMPTPQIAAVAVMALLAAGVVIGAVTDPLAQSAARPTILVSSPSAAAEEEQPAAAEPEAIEEIVEEEDGGTEIVNEAPAEVPPAIIEEPYEAPSGGREEVPIELPTEPVLPPITHLFLIVLGQQGYEAAFGEGSSAPYLSRALPEKGELLKNYYAVAPGRLANEIALLSGQGPTPQTAAGCPESTDVTPGTVAPATVGTTEEVEGTGCVYPAATQTLPGQLKALGQTWKSYVEAPAVPGPTPQCGPGPNPLAYFHSLLDSGECGEGVAGLDQLAPDLQRVSTEIPAFSYIVGPDGIADGEAFLETVVPEIEESDAYKVGGMIAITFAGAPQSGPAADSSACCGTPEYPNLPAPTVSVPDASGVRTSGGGGRVGMLLLSPYVLPGSVSEGYFNHYTFLRSVEELFGVTALGYAAEPSILPFDEAVYNNTES